MCHNITTVGQLVEGGAKLLACYSQHTFCMCGTGFKRPAKMNRTCAGVAVQASRWSGKLVQNDGKLRTIERIASGLWSVE